VKTEDTQGQPVIILTNDFDLSAEELNAFTATAGKSNFSSNGSNNTCM